MAIGLHVVVPACGRVVAPSFVGTALRIRASGVYRARDWVLSQDRGHLEGVQLACETMGVRSNKVHPQIAVGISLSGGSSRRSILLICLLGEGVGGRCGG